MALCTRMKYFGSSGMSCPFSSPRFGLREIRLVSVVQLFFYFLSEKNWLWNKIGYLLFTSSFFSQTNSHCLILTASVFGFDCFYLTRWLHKWSHDRQGFKDLPYLPWKLDFEFPVLIMNFVFQSIHFHTDFYIDDYTILYVKMKLSVNIL